MSDAKNALKAMLNGVMTEDVIKLAKKTNKVIEKLDGPISSNTKKQNYSYDNDEESIDWMAEGMKKVNEARKMGLDGVQIVNNNKKDVTADQINALLNGGIKKVKELDVEPTKKILNEIENPIKIYENKNNDITLSKISEMLKIVLKSDDGKEILKKALKEVLIDMKKTKK